MDNGEKFPDRGAERLARDLRRAEKRGGGRIGRGGRKLVVQGTVIARKER